MDPDNKNFEVAPELPEPVDMGSGGDQSEYRPAAAPETQPAPPVGMPRLDPAAAIPPTDNAFAMPVQGSLPTPPSPSASKITQDLIADDSDLIEKEWVMKAKAIVAHTKDDPHRQNEEMTKVKADYLKKRYNKDLKVNEG